MGVLIKGMEMPKSCDKCELMTANYGCAFVGAVGGESYRKRAWDCPLVEVPTPHGRLIDADAYCEFCKDDCHWRMGGDPSCEFCHMPNAPTVIESEGE